MIYASSLLTQASGSVGGATFSRNKGGLYIRSRAIPTNPNSTGQQAMRAYVSALSAQWKVLTAAQRTAWGVYAANTPVINAIGASVLNTGFNWFVACNSLRLRAGEIVVTNAPTTPGLTGLTAPTAVAISAASQYLTASVTATDSWAIDSGGGVSWQMSKPLSAGVDSVKYPVRYAGTTVGDTTTPPSTSGNISVPFAVVANQKVVVRVTAYKGDGRISAPITTLVTVGA